MKKKATLSAVVVTGIALIAAPVFAQSSNFTISADVPAADTASFAVSKVTPGAGPGGTDLFEPIDTTDLDFTELTLITEDNINIFLPDFFWVIDVGSNGAGNPDLSFTYNDTNNPNGANNDGTGLGKHGTVAYQKVVTNDDLSQTVTVIRGESLAESNTSGGIQEEDFAGGFLRVGVGIATGDPDLEEGDAAPFTQGDAPGSYTGILTLTATFD